MAASHDGQLLVTSQVGLVPRVSCWEVATKRWLFDVEGHESTVTALAFSEDDERLVTVGFDARHRASIFVWLTASLRAGGGVRCPPPTTTTTTTTTTKAHTTTPPTHQPTTPPHHPTTDLRYRRSSCRRASVPNTPSNG